MGTMDTRALDNDTRGWIMSIVSGIACVFGACVIFVDIFVRRFPGKESFRIQESNAFLACSLSLSFGVMLFSALYSMLPESKGYLKSADMSDQKAGFIMMGCFIGGFIGIQAVSRLLHQFMPSHVVDCDHSHEESTGEDTKPCHHSRRQSRASRARRRLSRKHSGARLTNSAGSLGSGHAHVHTHDDSRIHLHAEETTPLLDAERNGHTHLPNRNASTREDEMVHCSASPTVAPRSRAVTESTKPLDRRPSMLQVQKRVMSFVKDTKCGCDELGPCYGYTDPCGQECFKHLNNRAIRPAKSHASLRTTTGPFYTQSTGTLHEHCPEECDDERSASPHFRTSRVISREHLDHVHEEDHDPSCSSFNEAEDVEAQHHHHVPKNAFLSIGLQTSIAIALHKFPEGFITYATNHANPNLGFNVFMALFVHNIAEGFALALPLYMALGSRWRAMAWTALLGGFSQPIGAGMAVLWFKLASRTHIAPNAVAYGCLFSITSGIMVSVALQLFVESLSLNHNRNLCMFFGFLGMAILGLSNALVAGH